MTMAVDFDIECSIYRDAYDNYGRFVDMETGECIQHLPIREFCLTDRWKPIVDKLRFMHKEYGDKAKEMDEYAQTKAHLPGATLSGLFELKEVYNKKYQRSEVKSRITANLKQHTGFLCIDIDKKENLALGDMKNVLRILRHRQEVALLMRSCSGTGFFALIPLAFPERHKEQFAALLNEYKALGINLDKQCSDVTRVRFASYDEYPYVNLDAVPYAGLMGSEASQMLAPKATHYSHDADPDDELVRKVETLVKKLEYYNIDITNDYGDWFRIGFSLARLPEPWGRVFFHRVSRLCSKYNQAVCDQKFNELNNPEKIGIGTFFSICKGYGVTLR